MRHTSFNARPEIVRQRISMEIFGGVGDAVMPVFLLFKSRLGSQIKVSMFKDSNNFGIYVDIHIAAQWAAGY